MGRVKKVYTREEWKCKQWKEGSVCKERKEVHTREKRKCIQVKRESA